jgi:hypothetical protein
LPGTWPLTGCWEVGGVAGFWVRKA